MMLRRKPKWKSNLQRRTRRDPAGIQPILNRHRDTPGFAKRFLEAVTEKYPQLVQGTTASRRLREQQRLVANEEAAEYGKTLARIIEEVELEVNALEFFETEVELVRNRREREARIGLP